MSDAESLLFNCGELCWWEMWVDNRYVKVCRQSDRKLVDMFTSMWEPTGSDMYRMKL